MRSTLRGLGYLALGLLLLLGAAMLIAPSQRVVIGGSPFTSYSVTMVPYTSSSSSVIGSPSLSAAFIEKVFSTYDSPAVGLGRALYADSEQFHIDDVFALAFFLHESSFGTTGVARFTRSLGNIRCSGYPTCYEGYRSYPSWQVGAWDWFRLIKEEYLPRGLTTVQSIVPVYAPASDHNDVSAYIQAVLEAVSTWRAGRVWVG